MKKLIFLIIISIFITSLFSSCVRRRGHNRQINVVEDADAETRNDQTGDWNDADMRSAAKTLISQMLSQPWYLNALKQKDDGELPTVKIGKIKNKTDSHLPMDAFRDSLQLNLTNSGKLIFVASNDEAEKIRKERDEEMDHASDESAKEDGQEIAADYMLFGQFTSMSDRLGGKEVKYLQVNLKLIDMEKNVIVWIGEKKIKKFIRQRRRTW